MVKSRPRIPDRAARRRHRFVNKLCAHHRHLLKLASFSSSSPSSSTAQPHPNPTNTTTTSTTQENTTTTQKSPATPSSLSIRRKIRNFMKRSKSRTRSTSKSPSSPFYSPLSHSQSQSPSLSPSLSCSSSSLRKISLSPLTFSSPDLSPSLPTLPPLPPQPSPELLKRTVSDPVTLLPHLSGDIHNSTLKSSSSSHPVSRNLMGQLPPLPPSSSSSPSNLRRTFSVPVSLSPTYKDENVKRMKKEETVAVEKLSGEWIVVKFNCECGKDGHFLVNAADKKYFKLI